MNSQMTSDMANGPQGPVGDLWVTSIAEKVYRELAAKGCDSERQLRQKAFEFFASAPLPNRSMDEWRRTDPTRFPLGKWPVAQSWREEPLAEHPWDQHFDLVIAADDQRVSVKDSTGVVTRGLIKIHLGMGDWPDWVHQLMEDSLRDKRAEPRDKYSYLAAAFGTRMLAIWIASDVELPRGILVREHAAQEPQWIVTTKLVWVGQNARVLFQQVYDGPAETELLNWQSTHVWLGRSSNVFWQVLRADNPNAIHFAEERFLVAKDARLNYVTVNLGGRLTKVRCNVEAAEQGAQVDWAGLNCVDGERHSDVRTLQVHSAPSTQSRLLYKGVAKDRGYSIYQGQIHVAENCSGVDAYQRNNNLLLSEGARADSIPSLRIYNGDVKCSHGSTVGSLDPDQIFYLRSRGMSETQARSLLIDGFLEEVLCKVVGEPIRAYCSQLLCHRVLEEQE